MEGKLSDRAKELFNDPIKAKLLMEYILNPNRRNQILITIDDNGKVDIKENKTSKTLAARQEMPDVIY